MLDLQTPTETGLVDEWPTDPKEQLALADALDARARVAEHAVDLRQLAVQLRDAAWQ